MIATARRLRSVPYREWPALGAAFAVALFVELGLRVMKLPTLARAVGTSVGLEGTTPSPAPALRARFTGRTAVRVSAVQRLMRHWPCDGNCLRQSLVLGQRLRRYHPVLRVGVRRDESGVIRAHAWLEVEGRTLDPLATATFQGFVPFKESDSSSGTG